LYISPLPSGLDPVEETDILLARIMAEGGGSVDGTFRWHDRQREQLLAGALEFSGLAASVFDVRAGLAGRPGRLQAGAELGLLRGLDRALQLAMARSAGGCRPDGQLVRDCWSALVRQLPGQWPTGTRRHEPRDGATWLSYPPPAALPDLLAKFDEARAYLDFPVVFLQLHPIRQSFRILHRLCRMAPFADHNGLIGWLAACAFLHSHGYPSLPLTTGDREALQRMQQGGPPRAVPEWEQRLLEVVRSQVRELLG
jgi:hypothetical protein